MEQEISLMLSKDLQRDVQVEVFPKEVKLGDRERTYKMRAYCVTIAHDIHEEAKNLLLRENKYKGYKNIRFHLFGIWGDLTTSEVISFSKRHKARIKKMEHETVVKLLPIATLNGLYDCPEDLLLSQKTSDNKPLFYSVERFHKGHIVHYDSSHCSEAQKFLSNIGEMAWANIEFKNNDFQVLSKMKNISSQSTSYLNSLKQSLVEEPPPSKKIKPTKTTKPVEILPPSSPNASNTN